MATHSCTETAAQAMKDANQPILTTWLYISIRTQQKIVMFMLFHCHPQNTTV